MANSFFTPAVNRLIDIDYIHVKTHLFGKVIVPGSMHPFSMDTIQDPHALEIIESIHRAGYRVYIVGGVIRDWIRETPPKDYDLVSDIPLAEAQSLFGDRFTTHTVIGYTVAKVHYPPEKSADLAGIMPVPQAYDRFSLPQEFMEEPLFRDSMRRDLTINAIYFDPYTREIIDYHGGLKDIRDGIINTVFMPDVQFQWDPNSILRTIRFAARYRSQPEEDVELALRVVGRRYIKSLEAHTAYKNTIKLFWGGYGCESLRMLNEYRITEEIIPSLGLSENRRIYEEYLKKLMAELSDMDLKEFGSKTEYRAFIYAALHYPRFLEWQRRSTPEEAARLTIAEAFSFISVPDETAALLCEYLPRFSRGKTNSAQDVCFARKGALMARAAG